MLYAAALGVFEAIIFFAYNSKPHNAVGHNFVTMVNMKRQKLSHGALTMMRQDTRYLQSIAAELNNLGVCLQQIGDDEHAMNLHKEAALTEMEALHLQEPQEAAASEKVENRLALIMRAKEKMDKFDPLHEGSSMDSVTSKTDSLKTACFSFPLKIATGPSHDEPRENDMVSCQHENGSTAAIIMHNMGIIHYKQGHLYVAARMFEKGLEVVHNENGGYPFGALVVPVLLNNLGHIYHCVGNRSRAFVSFKNSWKLGREGFCILDGESDGIRDQEQDSDDDKLLHQYIATVLYNLGRMNSSKKDYANALKCLSMALKYADTAAIAVRIVVTMSCIGRAYQKCGMHDEALVVYGQALDAKIRFSNISSAFPATLYPAILHNVGFIHYQTGQLKTAKQALMLSFRLLETSLGNTDPDVERLKQVIGILFQTLRTSDIAAAA